MLHTIGELKEEPRMNNIPHFPTPAETTVFLNRRIDNRQPVELSDDSDLDEPAELLPKFGYQSN